MFEKIETMRTMRRLRRDSEYALRKMEEHINDESNIEFKNWANLEFMYLLLMLEKREELDVKEEETA